MLADDSRRLDVSDSLKTIECYLTAGQVENNDK